MLPPSQRETPVSRFRALRHRNYRLYWTGQLISLLGTWMQSVAQGWLMHRLTSSALMLGLLGFLQFLPVLLLTLWAGVVADHVDKRRLLIVTQSCFLLQAALLATLVSMRLIQPSALLGLAFAFGIFSAFDMPTRQAFIVEMVGKEDLSNAIALNSGAFNTARILGPAAAGVLVATAGEAACFWINAITYLAVIWSLWRIRLPERIETARPRGLSTLAEGVRYVLGVPALRRLLLLLGLTAGLGFQYMVLLPVYAREILKAGAQGYGLMVSAFGLGSLIAAGVMTRRLDRWDLRRNLLIGLSASGLAMGVFAWSRALPLTLAMGLLAGFGLLLYVASTNTLLQLTTEDRFRGRVMSLYTLMFVGTAPLGALASGWIAERWGAPVATSLSGAVLLLGALWVANRLRVLAAQETPQPTEPAFTEKLG